MRSSCCACDRWRRPAERSIGPASVPVAVVVVVAGAASFGVVVVVVVGELHVEDDPLRSTARARILLTTRVSNMIYWSSSSGVSRVTRASLSSALSPSYNEVHLAASFQDTSDGGLVSAQGICRRTGTARAQQ